MNDDRLRDLSVTIDQLKESVKALENRVGALEGVEPALVGIQSEEISADSEASTPVEEFGFKRPSATRVFSLLGRSILFLAGAFLLRALTDGGTLPAVVGFGLGLAYGLALIVLSDLSLRKGDEGGAIALGITATVVAFPFLFETTAVLKVVSPVVGGLVLVVISGVALGSAWLRSVRLLSWVYSMAAMITVLAMGFAAGAAEFFAGLLLALGVATMLMAYTRKWHIKRWVVAAAANVVIYRLAVLVTNPPSVGAGDHGLSLGVVQGLALALVLIYLGMFTYRALVQGRGVKIFDVVQSVVVVLVGFLGAIKTGTVGGISSSVLGWVALIAAAGYYTVAFTVVRQRHGRGRGFFYFASLALVFLFLGSRAVAEGPWLAWCWIVLGLVTAVLGGKFDRVTLRAHSAVYLLLASYQTGMIAATWDSYFGFPASVWRGVGISGFVALLVTTGCYWILVMAHRAGDDSRYRLLPRFFVAVLCLEGFSSLAIVLLVKVLAGTPPEAVAGTVAVVRTGILAVAAIGLAVAGRRKGLVELGWLVYPLLALGLGKLLWEDLRAGSPMGLAGSFALFGAAAVLAPRILRGGRKKTGEVSG